MHLQPLTTLTPNDISSTKHKHVVLSAHHQPPRFFQYHQGNKCRAPPPQAARPPSSPPPCLKSLPKTQPQRSCRLLPFLRGRAPPILGLARLPPLRLLMPLRLLTLPILPRRHRSHPSSPSSPTPTARQRITPAYITSSATTTAISLLMLRCGSMTANPPRHPTRIPIRTPPQLGIRRRKVRRRRLGRM